jgi:hypothetical protein
LASLAAPRDGGERAAENESPRTNRRERIAENEPSSFRAAGRHWDFFDILKFLGGGLRRPVLEGARRGRVGSL